jgi:hypothetical protein
MSHKPHTLAELKADLATVEAKLKVFNELAMERFRLTELIKAWETFFPEEGKSAQTQSTPVVIQNFGTQATASFAHHSLDEFGPMSTAQLLVSVRQKGWKGTGDDAKDRDRLYQAMKRLPQKFARTVDGKWAALKSKDQT